jgi:imidazolonepropionase-like amidohydrolase
MGARLRALGTLVAAPLFLLGGCGGDAPGNGAGSRGLGLGDWEGGAGVLVLEGALVFTSPLAEPIADGVVVVMEGRIEAVGARGEVLVPQVARRVDASGGALVAGFWDVHVRLDPWVLDAPMDPEVTSAELEGWFQENFSSFGFTGILETGTPLAELQPLLDRLAAEGIRAPRILATGGASLEGVEVLGGDAANWTDARISELLAAEATVVPALALFLPDGEATDAEVDRAQEALASAQDRLQALSAAGGRLAFGSGFGWGASQDPLLELELMEEAGIGFAALLESLTTEPAMRFGSDDRGEVEPGMIADLVLLDGDPRADLNAFERVRWVLQAGVPVYGRVR